MDPISSQLIRMGGEGTSEAYWIASLGDTGSNRNTEANGVALDSAGNPYLAGTTWLSGQNKDIFVAKYNSSGTWQWNSFLASSYDDQARSVVLDSSNNIYVTGETLGVSSSYDFYLTQLNTSGTVQWQRRIGTDSGDTSYSIARDSSNNLLISGYAAGPFTAKYDSSGTLQWQRRLGTSSDYSQAVATDSSGNVVLCGTSNSQGVGSGDLLIVKYNSSGTLQWQRSLGGGDIESGLGITTDASANIYVCGRTSSQGAGLQDALIAKYNSSGTIQWQRSLGGSGNDVYISVCVDTSGNIYAAGATGSYGLVAKYNSSGTLQWQRRISNGSTLYLTGITASSTTSIYVSGSGFRSGVSYGESYLFKLPADGSKTGTYGIYDYATASLTDQGRTLTDAARTLTDATPSLTTGTPSLGQPGPNLNSSTTTI